MTDLTFDGRVAIVTGAGRGLGRSHALELARRGARVVVNDIGGDLDGAGGSPSPAREVVDAITAAGGEAVVDGHSVATPQDAGAIVATALEAFGRLDVVVNNAGILRDRSFAKLTPEDLDAVLDVHLRGTLFVSQAAWPHLREQGYGRIVNTTSVAGYLGNFGQANYGAAKAGIIGLTNVLAVEGERYGIGVNVIAPGARTRMTEDLLGDLADKLDPELVTAAVVWLAHERCTAQRTVLSVGAGRVAEVFVAQTEGIFDAALSPETIEARWSEVTDRTGYLEPRNVAEEMGLMLQHLRD